MLERLGHFIVRRRWWVLAGTLLFVGASGALGGSVADHLKTGGFEGPDTESVRAERLLAERFGQAPPNFLLLVTAKQGTVDQDPARAAGVALTNELLATDGVDQVVSHWSLGAASPLVSRDRRKAIIVAQINGSEEAAGELADRLVPRFTREDEAVSVGVGGFEAVFREVSTQIEEDLGRAEAIAVPITLILLIVVFGSVVAAVMPVAIGIIAILGTFLVLRLVASLTDVSIFALSMVTAMGLGLAIDYSLFIVSRFREELRKGASTEDAVVTTLRTAGRTVIVSGSTVAVSLAALLVFPLYFFKSFGYAGIGVVATAVVGAVVFLPAMLAVLGPRVDKWAIRQRRPRDVGEGFWHRLAETVMRRPWPIAIGVTAILLVLGIPFLHVNPGLPDERVLPPEAATRRVHEVLCRDFPSEEVQSIRVVAPGVGDPRGRTAEIGSFAADVSRLDGVDHVDSPAGRFAGGRQVEPPTPLSLRYAGADAAWFQVIPSVDPFSERAEAIVEEIRSRDAPFDVLVGGPSAQLVDAKDSLFSRLPLAIAIIAVATFLMLFLMFGSLLVPAKALVLNFLSLTATFGAMVWIFQDGHLSDLLGFTATGSLDISSPILMFCIAFGLSMDFEVFMLSRIKEEFDATGDNQRSVAVGLERTGRIVTAAAALISVTFLAFGMSSVRFIKLFGIGMTLAVLMDAFVIRGTLVPAFMRLAGRANWWLPSFLQPLHRRLEIREAAEAGPAPVRRPVRRKPATGQPKARVNHRQPAARASSGAKRKPKPKPKAKPAARKASR